MNNKNLDSRILLAVLSSAVSMLTVAEPLKIVEFKKAQLSPSEQQAICQQAATLCHQPKLIRSLKLPDQSIWILSEGDIAAFQSSSQGLKLTQQWHVLTPTQDDDQRSSQYVYPKLFPLDQKRYAIAGIKTYSEMYSGGGANIERADFYELLANGQTKPLMQNYPFSFARMIRACFSEEDYERSKGDCHDEDGLSVDIQVLKPMLWQFRYAYALHVSPASDSDEKSYKGSRILNIDLNHPPTQPKIPETWNFAGLE